jgi:M-phase inducer tyrosine phosphatase
MPKVAFSSHRPTTIDFTAGQSMDVDTDTDTDEPLTAGLASIPASPARFGMDDDGDFSEFFGASPSTAPAHKTTFGSPNESPSSSRRISGGLPSRSQNPDLNKFERSFTAAPNMLFGSSRAATLASRPQATQRQRPSLAAFASLPSADSSSSQSFNLLRPESSTSTATRAAFPRVQPPMRRAFSTQQPFGDGLTTPSADEDSETSFFDDSPSQGPGGAAARLVLGQSGPAANGSPSVRDPMGAGRLRAGASALLGRKRSVKRESDSAPVLGLGGFGAEEMQGKVLPCYSVKADGLMRINPETVRFPLPPFPSSSS